MAVEDSSARVVRGEPSTAAWPAPVVAFAGRRVGNLGWQRKKLRRIHRAYLVTDEVVARNDGTVSCGPFDAPFPGGHRSERERIAAFADNIARDDRGLRAFENQVDPGELRVGHIVPLDDDSHGIRINRNPRGANTAAFRIRHAVETRLREGPEDVVIEKAQTRRGGEAVERRRYVTRTGGGGVDAWQEAIAFLQAAPRSVAAAGSRRLHHPHHSAHVQSVQCATNRVSSNDTVRLIRDDNGVAVRIRR